MNGSAWLRTGALVVAVGLGSGPATAAQSAGFGRKAESKQDKAAGQQLLGAWRLTADDDQPGKKPDPEVITFAKDGTWRVSEVKEPFGGRYRVDGEEVVMTFIAEGNTRVLRRGFKIDAQGLHFANVKTGFAHYVRVTP